MGRSLRCECALVMVQLVRVVREMAMPAQSIVVMLTCIGKSGRKSGAVASAMASISALPAAILARRNAAILAREANR